jgi:thiamine-phosphate pyrophosphorylase
MPAEGWFHERNPPAMNYVVGFFVDPGRMSETEGMTGKELSARLRLYVITDTRAARGRPLVDLVAAALDGGATAVQLRDKLSDAREQVVLGRELRRLTRAAGALLIVNDRVDVAHAIEADGVHLGQDDLPPAAARAILGPGAIVGGSAGNLVELARSLADGVDYLGVGPMYPTPSKGDAGPAIGPSALAEIRAICHLPIVGVGGIDASNLAPVLVAGADGVALISAIIGAEDVRAAARAIRTAIDRELAGRG